MRHITNTVRLYEVKSVVGKTKFTIGAFDGMLKLLDVTLEDETSRDVQWVKKGCTMKHRDGGTLQVWRSFALTHSTVKGACV